jgi:di/tricarboxylate transporter
MMFVAGILIALVGYWLGGRLRSTRAVNVTAVAALVTSGLGAYLWQVPPYRYLFETLRYAYVLAMFGLFFLSTGVLVRGLLARAWKTMRTSSD